MVWCLTKPSAKPGTDQPLPMKNVYASPREIEDIKDCYFYHTMDLAGY